MTGFVVIVALLVVCLLAPFAGAESRSYDRGDRGWMPTGRRPR
jgi:hypothetical protein